MTSSSIVRCRARVFCLFCFCFRVDFWQCTCGNDPADDYRHSKQLVAADVAVGRKGCACGLGRGRRSGGGGGLGWVGASVCQGLCQTAPTSRHRLPWILWGTVGVLVIRPSLYIFVVGRKGSFVVSPYRKIQDSPALAGLFGQLST